MGSYFSKSEWVPDLKLNDGRKIPVLGYGLGTALFRRGPEKDEEIVKYTITALNHKFYHLDGAEMYNNEEELGEAVRTSGIPREKIFVTTKLSARVQQDIQTAFDASLARLGLDYVDLYLIHSPYLFDTPEALQAGWAALERIKASGKARSIGVSNFLVEHLRTVLATATVKPAVNQIEFHPYLQRDELLAFTRAHGIDVEAYGPLTPITKAPGGPVDSVLEELAKKYKVTTGDVLLRWVIDQGIIAITTSKSEDRLKGYQDLLPTFALTKGEIARISKEGAKKHFRAFQQRRFAEDDRR